MKDNKSFFEEKFLLKYKNYINEIETNKVNTIEEIEYNSYYKFLPFKVEANVINLFDTFYFDVIFLDKTYRYNFSTKEIEIIDE